MKKSTFAVATLFLALSTFLYSFTPGNNGDKDKATTEFSVVPTNSTFIWTGKKLTGDHSGLISVSNGFMKMTGDLITSGKFEIDMNTITCTDIKDEKSNGNLVMHLKNDDFFAVDKFPTTTFEVISSEKTQGADASLLYLNVKGKLTIRGVSEEIVIPVRIAKNKAEMTCFANFDVDRTKFNVKYNSKKFFESVGDRLIYDEFNVDLKLNAKTK